MLPLPGGLFGLAIGELRADSVAGVVVAVGARVEQGLAAAGILAPVEVHPVAGVNLRVARKFCPILAHSQRTAVLGVEPGLSSRPLFDGICSSFVEKVEKVLPRDRSLSSSWCLMLTRYELRSLLFVA